MQETTTILVVDDEPRNLDSLEAILSDPAYRLLRAGDAEMALRMLLENDVAAIVLDIKMPTVSGFELARLIKGTKKFREVPIVFLTAYLMDDHDVLRGYGTGAVDFLTKPVNPEILRRKVGVFADLFRKTRALAELNRTLEDRVRDRTAELESSKAALSDANKKKDLFLATLAHELRNPLAPLRIGLDVLMQRTERTALSEGTLGSMNRQLEYMVRLIDDLMDVSRINYGTLEIRKERADLRAVIDRAIETTNPSILRRSQSIALDIEEQVSVDVDATRVAQVIANLLQNASKHSPSGARIRVLVRRTANQAIVQVVDEGVGIPPEQLARVFDMFTKIERSTESPNDGLGIGLALSRQLAELHGGALTAESAGYGKGATFSLTLPAGRSDPPGDRPAEIPQPSSKSEAASRAGLRIVVVEDNEDSADVMSVWLEQLGHEVRVARTGPDGVALIFEAHPDVVLCDIGLPGMDGNDVCRRVVQGMPEPPVMVALTGWGMEADRRRTVEAGFRHHIVKPVEPDKLRTVLESLSADGAPLASVHG